MSAPYLLEVRRLHMYFSRTRGLFGRQTETVRAVDDISFGIYGGETFGLVGESGCGKSTTGYSIVRLYKPTSGEILYKGTDIAKLDSDAIKPYRQKIQMIFQDPYASLNPRMTVADIIGEPLDIHKITPTSAARQKKILALLERVGLAKDHAGRYPHEFSGGQRQRVGIARALAIDPEFIVCDEPISALDVSIQAQVVNMLEDLQKEFGLTYLFIAHDLSMVRHISDRVGVMYLGSLVEVADTDELYDHYMHPYTKALLSSVPVLDPVAGKAADTLPLQGEVPGPIATITGCKFASRCPFVKELCYSERPPLIEVSPDHAVACHYPLTDETAERPRNDFQDS